MNSNPIVNLSFDGLNHRDQRLANAGNQFRYYRKRDLIREDNARAAKMIKVR